MRQVQRRSRHAEVFNRVARRERTHCLIGLTEIPKLDSLVTTGTQNHLLGEELHLLDIIPVRLDLHH